jgi:hypothetical protein
LHFEVSDECERSRKRCQKNAILMGAILNF